MSPMTGVLVDLDDTLYPQAQWLEGAWERVADHGRRYGVDSSILLENLTSIAAKGSDQGHIIDKALAASGGDSASVKPLVAAFMAHRPTALRPYTGVTEALVRLGERHSLAIVTDGVPSIQRAKVKALGIRKYVDLVLVSDDVSRAERKPSPSVLIRAMRAMDCSPTDSVMIGDRPEKDVAAASAAGVRSVRVRTGEYRASPDVPMADVVVNSFAEAAEAVLGS